MTPQSSRNICAPPGVARLDDLAADERLAEIGRILAVGLLRLRMRTASRNADQQSTGLSADGGESSLHFSPGQSGPDRPGSLEVDA